MKHNLKGHIFQNVVILLLQLLHFYSFFPFFSCRLFGYESISHKHFVNVNYKGANTLWTCVETINSSLVFSLNNVPTSSPDPLKRCDLSFQVYFEALMRERNNSLQVVNQLHGELLGFCFITISPRDERRFAWHKWIPNHAEVFGFVYSEVSSIILSTQGKGHSSPHKCGKYSNHGWSAVWISLFTELSLLLKRSALPMDLWPSLPSPINACLFIPGNNWFYVCFFFHSVMEKCCSAPCNRQLSSGLYNGKSVFLLI